MKMLPIAVTGLIASLLFQCHSEAQVRTGRKGGVSVGVPQGGRSGGRGSGGPGISSRGPSNRGISNRGPDRGSRGFNGRGYSSRGYGGLSLSTRGYGSLGYGSLGYGNRGYSGLSFSTRGFSTRGYGGYSYGGYGPHVGIPIYPTPYYRVPAYRVPAYSSYAPRNSTFSIRIEPRRTYVAPSRSYVYPQPYADPFDAGADSYGSDLDQVYGNYQSARPVAPVNTPDYSINGFNDGVTNLPMSDEPSLLQSAVILKESLSRRRDDADIWLNYLNPDLIIDIVQSGGDGSALQDLLKNYDGLSGNSDLSNLWVEPGFRRTHQGLRSYIENSAVSVPDQSDALLSTPLSAEGQSDPVADSVADPLTDSQLDSQPDAVEELPIPVPEL